MMTALRVLMVLISSAFCAVGCCGYRKVRGVLNPTDQAKMDAAILGRQSIPICPRCNERPVQNNGQGSCDTCATA